MNNFKENVKVSKDKINPNAKIIRKLNKLETVYNKSTESLPERIKILRSGENVFLNIMLISGLLFSIQDSSRNVIDASVIGRVKSPESISKKANRKGRENKISKDIIAYNIVIDRIHNSKNFYNLFRSSKIQSLYNERKSNIDLMQMVVDFINSFEMYGVASELDENLTVEETKENSKRRLENMKDNCSVIAKNIERYNKEEETRGNEFFINKSLLIMCEELLDKEIIAAMKKLSIDKHRLEQEIENEENYMSQEMLAIKKKNLENMQEKIDLLDNNQSRKTAELIEILAGKINEDNVMLYTSIIEYLKKQEINDIIKMDKKNEKEEGNEKKYCELLILVLYQLSKLEFVKDGQYEGLVYNNIVTNLHNLLKEYKNCEIDKRTYGNVTFEDLQKLTTNLIRLNARLSDQLQFEIAKYEMDHYLKSIINRFTGVENLERDEKIKPNGYVSIHYDADSFEVKITTHYRNRVASRGSAAYGNGRIDNKNEKKREIKRLKYKSYLLKPVKMEECPIIKMAKLNKDYAEKITSIKQILKNDTKYENVLLHQNKLEDIWREELLQITPRYFGARYNDECVIIGFFSDLKNVKKYYSETSVILIRDEVEKSIEDIRKEGEKRRDKGKKELLSDKPYIIKISREQYYDFINYELRGLRDKIDSALEQSEKKTINKGETK